MSDDEAQCTCVTDTSGLHAIATSSANLKPILLEKLKAGEIGVLACAMREFADLYETEAAEIAEYVALERDLGGLDVADVGKDGGHCLERRWHRVASEVIAPVLAKGAWGFNRASFCDLSGRRELPWRPGNDIIGPRQGRLGHSGSKARETNDETNRMTVAERRQPNYRQGRKPRENMP